MVSRIKNIIKAIATRLSFLPMLPGQGIFGSERFDEMDFTITMYKSDIERANDKINVGRVADEFVDEYVDCMYNQLTLALEGAKHSENGIKAEDTDGLYRRLSGRSDIVVGESAGKFMTDLKKFRPARKKQTGMVRYIGTLDKARVYVNSCAERGKIYVIDRSVIDVKYDIRPGSDRIDLNIKTKINNESVTKYSLIS